GELSLDGQTKTVKGILSMVHAAKENGIKRVAVPVDNVKAARLISGITVLGIKELGQLRGSYDENSINDTNHLDHLYSECADVTSLSTENCSNLARTCHHA